jgi:hypothetical protein
MGSFSPLSLALNLGTDDVESDHSVVGADAECGTHKCRFTKAIEKGLG